jgi:ABC-type transport system involved in cytochrome bd biosynthesis fused ATPase/permease subunit
MAAPLLEVRDLRVAFQTDAGLARAVDGVSFQIGPGEIVGLVGESGSGKSVTSLSALGLVPTPPGRIEPGSSIRFRGEELVGAPERRLRQVRGNEIAMIFQEPMTSLNPVHRVGAQIVESLRLHRGLGRREAWARAVDLQREVGLECLARVRPRGHRAGIGDDGAAEEGHLLGEHGGMRELLADVDLELVDGARVLGAGDHRHVLHVLGDRLQLRAQVVVEGGDQLLLGELLLVEVGRLIWVRPGFGHGSTYPNDDSVQPVSIAPNRSPRARQWRAAASAS